MTVAFFAIEHDERMNIAIPHEIDTEIARIFALHCEQSSQRQEAENRTYPKIHKVFRDEALWQKDRKDSTVWQDIGISMDSQEV